MRTTPSHSQLPGWAHSMLSYCVVPDDQVLAGGFDKLVGRNALSERASSTSLRRNFLAEKNAFKVQAGFCRLAARGCLSFFHDRAERTDPKVPRLNMFGGLGCSEMGSGVTFVRNTQTAQIAIVTTVNGAEIAARSQALPVNFIWPPSLVCTN